MPILDSSSSDADTTPLLLSIKDERGHLSTVHAAFNAMNVLVGIGILSLPFAFRVAGWLFGSFLLFLFMALTNYTARLVIRCLDYQSSDDYDSFGDADMKRHRMNSFADIGRSAFGWRGQHFIAGVFMLELFAAGVALIILISDSLNILYPQISLVQLKIVIWFLITPMLWFKSLKWLSYASILGIITVLNLIVVIILDGFSLHESPGSLWHPSETHLLPPQPWKVPLVFGLIMAGFSGHAIFPNIYREMKSPEKFPLMLNISYSATLLLYTAMACIGYQMFGDLTMDEITKNLALAQYENLILTKFTIWLIAINPVTKYALTLQPVATFVEDKCLNTNGESPVYRIVCESSDIVITVQRSAVRIIWRTSLSLIVLLVAIYFPGFERVIGVLGSVFSFTVSVLFPIVCYIKFYGSEMRQLSVVFHWILFGACTVMAVTGTVWAIICD